MTGFRLYNTLTRKVEPFATKDEGKARVYTCGPTVYDVPHAGHARAAVAPDVLVRRLRKKGYEVTYVRNITDVDDKILARAKDNGEEPLALSKRMAKVYQDAVEEIGCLAPDEEPRVSDHLPQIYELIQKILDNGAAYVVDREGGVKDIYFSVESFSGYGKLSHRKLDEMRAGARVEVDEVKREPADFALWKGAPAEEWGWDSPWGRGRPGWHIECSAMSSRYLGHGFDVHCGGMDLIFPHHENEIAQSEAACPGEGPFARFWVHNGFVNIDKEKMSKSLGNFVTIQDVFERNDPEGFRWFLLSVHYRGPIQFDTETLDGGRVVFPGVDEAEGRVDYVYDVSERLDSLMSQGLTVPAKKPPPELAPFREAAAKSAAQAEEALDDDLNTSVALAALGEMARTGNDLCDLAHKRRKDATFVGAAAGTARVVFDAISKLTEELGLLQTPSRRYRQRTRARRLALRSLTEEQVNDQVSERDEARKSKNFARADELREALEKSGVVLKDTPDGTEWTIDV